MDLKKAIRERKSIRAFLDKKPDWQKILRAIDASRFAPAAGNLSTLKFILVSNKEKIKQLVEASQQPFFKNVHYVVVAVSDETIPVKTYQERGKRYTSQQAGAAIENFLLALTEEGLATTWVGYFYEEQIKRVLNIPEKLIVEAMFPIGIEGKQSKHHNRLKPELDCILYFDKWKNTVMEPKVRVTSESV